MLYNGLRVGTTSSLQCLTDPSAQSSQSHNTVSLKSHMQIGAESYTQHPVRTDQESYYQLRNTSGHQSSTVHNDATAAPDYHENKCIIVIDIKRVFRQRDSQGSTPAQVVYSQSNSNTTSQSQVALSMQCASLTLTTKTDASSLPKKRRASSSSSTLNVGRFKANGAIATNFTIPTLWSDARSFITNEIDYKRRHDH